MASLNRAGLARLRSVLQSHIDRQRIPGAIAVVALGYRLAGWPGVAAGVGGLVMWLLLH